MKPTYMSEAKRDRAESRRERRQQTEGLPLRERLALIDALREQDKLRADWYAKQVLPSGVLFGRRVTMQSPFSR